MLQNQWCLQLWKICYNPLTLDTHCCHMGTVIKHPVLDWVKPSFVIFDILVLWRSALSVRVPRCQKLQIMADRMLYSRTHMATVGIKGLRVDLFCWRIPATKFWWHSIILLHLVECQCEIWVANRVDDMKRENFVSMLEMLYGCESVAVVDEFKHSVMSCYLFLAAERFAGRWQPDRTENIGSTCGHILH